MAFYAGLFGVKRLFYLAMHKSFTEQIKALSKISKAITSDFYLDDILRLIVTVTAEVMDSNICSLMLIDEKTNELVVRATQSISEEYNKKPPLKIGEGIAGKVAQENKPIAIKDVTKEHEYKHKDIAKKEGLSSLLCVPMSVKGKVIGVINCYTSKPYNFSDEEIEVLTTIANQAAVAIENTGLMVKSKVIQEELETRKRIERAKGILMRDEGLTEEQAYLKIRKYSMDNRKTMREVAEAIILAADMKHLTGAK
ncbi:MAG: GAF and ANTAR domain-containing protein [Candidatus Omnitrophota bacterium]